MISWAREKQLPQPTRLLTFECFLQVRQDTHQTQNTDYFFKTEGEGDPLTESETVEIKLCPQVTQSRAKLPELHIPALFRYNEPVPRLCLRENCHKPEGPSASILSFRCDHTPQISAS